MEHKKIEAIKVEELKKARVYEFEGLDGKMIAFPSVLAYVNYLIAHCENLHEITGTIK